MILVAGHLHFVYHQIVNVEAADTAASSIAAAIGEPARARMLYCLADGRARTSTELAILADVSPSTASVHLQRLRTSRLVKVFAQGKHRYYSLEGPNVAAALEALSVLAGGTRDTFVPSTPEPLRAARTCYDHIAGSLGVALHDRICAMGWMTGDAAPPQRTSSPPGEPERSKGWEWMWIEPVGCAAVSRLRASTGASGGRISAARWGPPF